MAARSRTRSAAGLAAIAVCLAVCGGPARAQEVAAALDRTEVPAAGRGAALLQISRFGRYAVTVTSAQGVSLQLVDRMAGPGPVEGEAGERDGRIDAFLDRGEYQVVTRGHPSAAGRAALTVHPFQERNEALRLVELKAIRAELGDLEQRSYWLELPQARWVALEAAGRFLADLRLWQDGSWLVDAEPERAVVTPVAGRPLLACRLAARLEPGLYRLVAYGGPPQAWAEEAAEKPFHLRWGIPRLAAEGRSRFRVSPFGVDRWLVPARANYFRLELPEAKPAELGLAPFDPARAFAAPHLQGRIGKDSRVPAVELTDGGGDLDVVTVTADAGEPYLLQQFESRWQYHFRATGEHWISTLHTGHPSDSVDATGILVRNADRAEAGVRPLRAQTLDLDPERGWSRRCNLLEPLTLFVRVAAGGSYRVDLEGVPARYRFEPFLLSRPQDYRVPPLRAPGTTWELDPGFYVLTVEPEERGIVTVRLSAAGAKPTDPGPARPAVRFEQVPLVADGAGYTLVLNRQPGVQAGILVRPLPLDLTEPLPVALEPGQTLEFPVWVAEPSRVAVAAEDGSPVDVGLDAGPLATDGVVAPGRHALRLRHDRPETLWVSAGLRPTRLDEEAPLPPLPAGALAALPEFPTVTAQVPRTLELGREQRRTFLVEAERDALYRLETTGLLDTEGVLRSRVVTALARAGGGGTGRNFLLHPFLRTGTYQLTIGARGRSQGPLALSLAATDPVDGGELRDGVPARAALGPGESVAYTFRVAETGAYRLRSLGLGRTFPCRLEDAGGWPVKPPNLPADFDEVLEPGTYRLILLPEPVASRRVTVLERRREPPRLSGHGPHPLPLSTPLTHRWHEPEEGQPRQPDVWRVVLPADAPVEVSLQDGMTGRLLRDDTGEEVAWVPLGKGWQGDLAAGTYRLEAVCARIDNGVDYRLEVRSRVLVPGLSLPVAAPAAVAVAVGGQALVELGSFGSADVRARLRDAGGRVVAAADDREGDWNFHISARLRPGLYRLEVEPVGAAAAETRVRMETREAADHAEVRLPAAWTADPGDAVHLYPLAVPEVTGLLLVSAEAAESVGLALEARGKDGGWEDRALAAGRTPRVEVALPAPGPLRLRVWSADRRGTPVSVRAAAARLEPLPEAALARGEGRPAPEGLRGELGAYDLAGPGTLLVAGGGDGLRWADRPGAALLPAARGLLTPATRRLWLAADGELPRPERAVLAPGAGIQVAVGADRPAALDLAEADGHRVALASAMVGQPGISFGGPPGTPGPRDAGVDEGGAAAVAFGAPAGARRLWVGAGEPGAPDVDVRVTHLAYPRSAAASAGPGRQEGELRGLEERTLALPAGAKRFRLSTSGHVVAAFAAGQTPDGVHWDGQAALDRWGFTRAERLHLFHTREEADRFSLEILPAAEVPAVARGRPFAARPGHAGTLRLEVRGPGRIHVHGARGPATLVRPDGAVLRGADLELGDLGDGAAELLVPHGPGLLLAWVSPAGGADPDRLAGLWAGVPLPPVRPAELPAAVAGADLPALLRLTRAEPSLLRVRAEGPCALRLTGAGGQRHWLLPEGGAVHAFLAAGGHELAALALGDGPSAGRVEVEAGPAPALGEGLGPEVLLPPGGGRAFRFTLARPATVGVGVRAEADVVDLTLADGRGAVVGTGVVQMHELAAGEYALVLTHRGDGAPVRARPAVVGLAAPGRGPPAEVVRRYVEEGR